MKQYKILFLDVDGTILTSEHAIQPSTVTAIHLAKEQGIKVFLATGRPIHELDDLSQRLGITAIIGYNGAFATDNGKELYNKTIDPMLVDSYQKTAQQYNHDIVLYTRNANLFTRTEPPYVKDLIRVVNMKKNFLYQKAHRHDILGMTMMNVEQDQIQLYTKNESLFFSPVIVAGLEKTYDVIQRDVNKGTAVTEILNALAIRPEQAIAFGDGLNDREMLSIVGQGFAMGNAHPDLFQYASMQTTSVDDNGIYNGLRKLGLVE
ncbi:hypothetical protein SAMN04488134_101624 [Amphibacillus marinus]|uniref:Cof subfamily of IIB subfamily of haloacid dehalogenase superfamily/HAD-superfamily hydrolase, subfamily IIB n=1 Tax=Amphibacillus marinus TaxID=872970 RepID=A0A1H8IIK1_9BACI|nr:HAD family hydrolase [Amphibacillus marinus]SEN68089.1 hypothetical protein SAMN04488134_101624 [Amphibacillus marinus]